ncbi:thioredoxin family protein [Luteibacter aegosomatissinici]|uniref:thioredoxin family protein n=1 Tax=Luteibacter aegosomatissinici TaxID=2911539 RepID=UPI001FFBCE2E|nr:thioredoxin family protein [Luteibacter aegosomatissinici]UPG95283.1 thioredoxin family protein [Luteibacter aegosomatissinici]
MKHILPFALLSAALAAGLAMPVRAAAVAPFDGATGWLNTRPFTDADLRGKVIVVNFWTYSCINSLRQVPYVRAWADKYKSQGLVVIGVHSPEFGFERDATNIQRAVKEYDVNYPVAIDSDHRVWDTFNNEYWPALYFIDAKGTVRHAEFGEGNYDKSELLIRQLLAEAGNKPMEGALVDPAGQGAEAPADTDDERSPETYTGYGRTEQFASAGGVVQDQMNAYSAPKALQLNHWALAGNWRMGREYATSGGAGSKIVYRFHARDLHLVLGPSVNGASVRFRVTIDGKAPGSAHGVDTDAQGSGTIDQPRMYQLIRQTLPITDHVFTIEFLDPGAQAYSFTFG